MGYNLQNDFDYVQDQLATIAVTIGIDLADIQNLTRMTSWSPVVMFLEQPAMTQIPQLRLNSMPNCADTKCL